MKGAFNQKNCQFFKNLDGHKCLVAVSGGVDSMVLLDLLLAHPSVAREQIVVAHFNHGLRRASFDEEDGLRDYCQRKGVIFCSEQWGIKEVTKNIEGQAREARYAFFEKIAKEKDLDYLLTAHHQDDLAETVLMKLINGSRLTNLVGIRPLSQRGELTVVRLLLDFSKQDIFEYAKKQQLIYWEDETNQDTKFQRNRIRHQVIPLLKEENPQVLNQFSHFVKQVGYASELIDSYCDKWTKDIRQVPGGWEMDITGIEGLAEGARYFLVEELFQQTIIPLGIEINRKQMNTIEELVIKATPAWRVDLAGGWQLYRSYQLLQLRQVVSEEQSTYEPRAVAFGITDVPGGQLILSDQTELKDQEAGEFTIGLTGDQLPLVVRPPRPGDKLVYNEKGQRKKINRLFIDKKIPRGNREKFLVIEDNKQQILSLFYDEESYLSIMQETDRIHYRLTYLLKK